MHMAPHPDPWEILGSRVRELDAGEHLTCTSGAVWVLVLEGEVGIRGSGPASRLGDGDAALLRRPSLHRATAERPSRVVVAELRLHGLDPGRDVQLARGFAGRQGGVVALLTTCPLHTAAQLATDDPAAVAAGLGPAYGQLLAAAMRAAIADAAGTPEVPCMDPAVRSVALAVTAAPAHGWTIAELGRIAMLGRTALSVRFQETMGMSPMRFVRRVRVERAAHELGTTDRTVTAVAFSVGYGSTAAFVRAFVAEMGRPPGCGASTVPAHRTQAAVVGSMAGPRPRVVVSPRGVRTPTAPSALRTRSPRRSPRRPRAGAQPRPPCDRPGRRRSRSRP